jgi:hypothetical protein
MRFLAAFSIVALAALLICVTLLLFFRSNLPPLTVVPTGQPRPVTGAGIVGASQVYLSVAVTNNTQSSLAGHVRLGAKDNPTPFFDPNDFFNLGPHAGTVCTVPYYTNSDAKWILRAEYMKVRSAAEVKLRSFLFRLGVPGVTTNYDWNFITVGQIVQH